jgi:hypothetical protein
MVVHGTVGTAARLLRFGEGSLPVDSRLIGQHRIAVSRGWRLCRHQRILGAYCCPEPLSTAAEKALQFKTPVISGLGEVEFCSLISKKYRLDKLRERQGKEILDLFSNHVAEGVYQRISLNTERIIQARLLGGSMDSSLRTLDALQVAAALAEGLTLV